MYDAVGVFDRSSRPIDEPMVVVAMRIGDDYEHVSGFTTTILKATGSQSRFYSRMWAARRPDAKYIRIDRIPDEAYRLNRDPGERMNLTQADDHVLVAERALHLFETSVDSTWERTAGDNVVDEFSAGVDERAQQRLRELGYVE